jgi:cysteine-rich repeat protein
MPDRGCSLLPRLAYDGDPGFNCSTTNYGINHRDDGNCDGVEDHADLCYWNAEFDQDLDSNGDCADGTGGDCRGDECECGDVVGSAVNYPPGSPYRGGNGIVDVSDLVAINVAIFNELDGTKRSTLADTNNDINITVSDVVGLSIELFRPDSSLCRQLTPRQCGAGIPEPCCGNGAIEAGEFCDDADLDPGDGCNGACRVEFGFTCDNDPPPSVCTP